MKKNFDFSKNINTYIFKESARFYAFLAFLSWLAFTFNSDDYDDSLGE